MIHQQPKLATSEQQKGNEAENVKQHNLQQMSPAENKISWSTKTAETTVLWDQIHQIMKNQLTSQPIDKQPTNTIVAGTDRSAVATPAKEDTQSCRTKAQAAKNAKQSESRKKLRKKQKGETTDTCSTSSGTREEQIRKCHS